MEDIHITSECPVSKWILFAVCDGHGGTAVVKYLEKTLSKRVLAALGRASVDNATNELNGMSKSPNSPKSPYSCPIRPSYLRQCMKLLVIALDSELEREIKSTDGRGSGSTLIMMAYQPLTRQIVLVNVGDSRAVLSLPITPPALLGGVTALAMSNIVIPANNKNVRKIIETKDHKPNDKEEILRVLAAGSHVTRNRVGGILALSRAMGDFSLKKSLRLPYDPVNGAVCALPDVQVGHISPNSFASIILGCDGLWDVMSSEEAIQIAETALDNKENPAEKLVHVAFAKMSSDNLTCLFVRLHPVFHARATPIVAKLK